MNSRCCYWENTTTIEEDVQKEYESKYEKKKKLSTGKLNHPGQ